jgi:hypothetical protein
MKRPVQISIPAPCHENWAAMTPADKGRFCGACQKNVVDFIRSSDREIAAYFKQNDNVCGRFNDSQLGRDLIAPPEKSPLWPAAAAVLTLMSLTTGVRAQTQVTSEQQLQVEEEILGKIAFSLKIISGKVTGPNGPLQCVAVAYEGSGISVLTDSDGGYSIEARPGQMLVFTYKDFLIQKNIIDLNTEVIDLLFEQEILDEVVVTACRTPVKRVVTNGATVMTTSSTCTIVTRRTFFGRIFYVIGNLFR